MRQFQIVARGLAAIALLAATATAALERSGGDAPRFHDPSTPVKQGAMWVVFSTGNGILTRYSQDLNTWTAGDPVFKTFPTWHQEIVPTQKGHLWAPDVIRQGEKYFLYYSVSAWGKNTSAIGLATSPTLDPKSADYCWKDEGAIIRSSDKSPYNAIDPAIFSDTDGRLWMTFGSFWSGIQLIELDAKSGLRKGSEKPRQLAWNKTIEASALTKHCDFYYLFVNWGLCCRGVDSTYEIRIGRSKAITGPYLDAAGEDLATGGGTLFLKSQANRIGPGHPSFIEENSATRMFFHYYDRKRSGAPTLGNVAIEWTADGWPSVK